ncbi:hypothetical protein FHX74_000178 [Friedmanniella endophytica]|uniref:JmjC domain-containing protein n=1 Tax=Microlunatus kandeliicorticis TaxID=1759536 RepID=A0A7W3P468_9ACTN|nr:cupin domain-containing protein [Microlunatus kandeliicorticis]MBA8792584.1 hypothetical protein [Microlunatus kandeliicorticis]
MTNDAGVPGDPTVAGHPAGATPALDRLITLGAEAFAGAHWGRAPLLSTAAELGGDFTDLLDAAAVDELVSDRGLRSPFLRVAKDGSTLPVASFTAGGGIGATVGDQVSDDKLTELFASGATMVLQGLHRVWPPILDFCQQLAAELGHPVQANAYVTPPQNQGFDDHYDVHDVFVLQIDGEKEWTIHAPVLDAPLRTQPWTDRRSDVRAEAAREPLIHTVLRPGDCLYLPRGYLHAAKALGGVSTHLTIGVHAWTRYHLAEQLGAAALEALTTDVEARGSLPFGVDAGATDDLGPAIDLIREKLVAAVRAVPDHVVARALGRQARDAQRAAPVGPLAQLRAAAGLEPEDRLVLRPHLRAELVDEPDGTVLVSRAGRLTLEPAQVAAVKPLLAGEPTPVAELGVELARTLLRAAVAVRG